MTLLVGPGALITELRRSDWRLGLLLAHGVEIAERDGFHLKVTGVERSRERTLELYAKAHQPAPQASVHEAKPCRGCDLIPVSIQDHGDPGSNWRAANEYGPKLAARLNARWVYPRGKTVALWHSVSGEHLHLQVPYDELILQA